MIAKRLQDQCSPDDVCVRFGGDGFAIVQMRGERGQAEDMARRVIATLSVPLDLSIGSRCISCSVGLAIADEAEVDALELVRRADLALHVAKQEGRSRECLFEPALDDALKSRHQLLEDLRTDLAKNRLQMVYQPQVDGFGNIIGVEALVRWTHSKLGPISPAMFVPLAECCGLISELGEFTIRRVLEDVQSWPDLKVAINISAIQLRMPGFAAQLIKMTSAASVDPARIEIELTESVLLTDDDQIHLTLRELRGAGFSLALDDFGTGYSSLSYLRRFPIDKIKIDRAFIGTLGVDKGADAVVRAIVSLAHALNLSVIAEGVETNDQWRQLLEEGCSDIQGYIASKPVEASRILALLEANKPICPVPAVTLAA
jgi:EAL domain-containing protein (putative c-di-GMP-specific phosphodiesterase class I)